MQTTVKRPPFPETFEGWVGYTVTAESELTVERGLIMLWLEAMRDGNPIYWDDTIAEEIAGGVVAPPHMTMTFGSSQRWSPRSPDEVWDPRGTEENKVAGLRMPVEAHYSLKEFSGLPEGIVVRIESEFHEPMRLGDRLTVSSSIVEIGELRTNRLGTGRNWLLESTFRNQNGQLVSTERYYMYCYTTENP